MRSLLCLCALVIPLALATVGCQPSQDMKTTGPKVGAGDNESDAHRSSRKVGDKTRGDLPP